MKNWKRLLSVLLAVVLVGTMLSGLALAEDKKEVQVPYKSIEVVEEYKKQELMVNQYAYLINQVLEEYEDDPEYDPEKEVLVYDTLQWKSSDTSIAFVDKNGRLKTRKAGKITVTVSSEFKPEIKDTFEIEVKEQKPVTKVSLSNTTFEVKVGEYVNLSNFLTIEPTDAQYDDITIKSSDPEVLGAHVDYEDDDDDEVYLYIEAWGKKAGTATATIKVTNKDGSSVKTSATFTVTEKELKSLSFSKSSVTFNKLEKDPKEDPINLWDYLTVDPENADFRNSKLKWESSNEDVATVSNGYVSAGRAGTATITVKSRTNPKIKAEIEVKVVEATAIDKIKFDDKSITLYFIAKFGKEYDDRNDKYVSFDVQPAEAKSTIKNVTWTTSDANVAIPSAGGKDELVTNVTAVGQGKCTITVYVTDQSGNKYNASFKVKVKEKSPTAKLSKTSMTLKVGKKKTLEATDADSKVKLTGKWTSSNKKVAKVDKKTGKVKAVAPGRAIITFKPDNKAYEPVTCVVKVK